MTTFWKCFITIPNSLELGKSTMGIFNSVDDLWFVLVGTFIVIIPLFIGGYLARTTGFAVVIIFIAILVYLFNVYAHAMGKAFANASSSHNPPVDMDGLAMALIAAIYMVFLSFGLSQLVQLMKDQKQLTLPFYIWLLSVTLFIIGTAIQLFSLLYNSEIAVMERENEKRYSVRVAETSRQERMRAELKKLYQLFSETMAQEKKIKQYISLSEKLAKKYHSQEDLDTHLANYATKLIIEMIKLNNYDDAKKIFDSYVDVILTHSSVCDKSTDVASNALVLSLYMNDSNISQRVFDKILGDEFDIASCTNEFLLFNIACYYSKNRDKKLMLPAIKRSLENGKQPRQFYEDSDFSFYLQDKDFVNMLSGEQK